MKKAAVFFFAAIGAILIASAEAQAAPNVINTGKDYNMSVEADNQLFSYIANVAVAFADQVNSGEDRSKAQRIASDKFEDAVRVAEAKVVISNSADVADELNDRREEIAQGIKRALIRAGFRVKDVAMSPVSSGYNKQYYY